MLVVIRCEIGLCLNFFLNSFLFGVSIEIQFEYFLCRFFFSFANHIYSRFTIDPFSIFAICFKFGVVFLQSFFATKKTIYAQHDFFVLRCFSNWVRTIAFTHRISQQKIWFSEFVGHKTKACAGSAMGCLSALSFSIWWTMHIAAYTTRIHTYIKWWFFSFFSKKKYQRNKQNWVLVCWCVAMNFSYRLWWSDGTAAVVRESFTLISHRWFRKHFNRTIGKTKKGFFHRKHRTPHTNKNGVGASITVKLIVITTQRANDLIFHSETVYMYVLIAPLFFTFFFETNCSFCHFNLFCLAFLNSVLDQYAHALATRTVYLIPIFFCCFARCLFVWRDCCNSTLRI